jgi:hypothetical protein
MGASGCAPGGAPYSVGCYITGHDLETGKELWRFNTVAQPGEPGGESWNNLLPTNGGARPSGYHPATMLRP